MTALGAGNAGSGNGCGYNPAKIERMVFMKSIVRVNDKIFPHIEDAVEYVKKQKLELADIDIYKQDDEDTYGWVETISVSREENYEYYAYALFVECDGVLEWYDDDETCYSSAQEVWDLLSSVPDGKYQISRVTQTLHEYRYTDEIETVEVSHHHYKAIQ